MSSDRISKIRCKIVRPSELETPKDQIIQVDKKFGVSFVPRPSTYTGATILKDVSERKDQIKEKVTAEKPNSLLSLTPICFQNTDLILNTWLFMCLDQGHDFRAGDSRNVNLHTKCGEII